MRTKYIIIIIIMAGLISIAGNCLSGQWSAARRPQSSSGGSSLSSSTSIAQTGGEFARPIRSFRCQPVSRIRRPRGWSNAKKSAPEKSETTKITPVKAPPIEQKNETAPATTDLPEPAMAAIAPSVPAAPAPPDTGETPASPPAPSRKAAASYGKVPPYFIRNDGQLDQAVRYYVKGPRGTVYLTGTEVVFDFLQENSSEEGEDKEAKEEEPGRPGPEREEKKTFTRLVFRQQFKDSNPEVKVDGKKELPGKINYFVGGKDNWHSNIPTVEEVFYHDLYPGIDLNCFFEGANIRYRYTVKPGADPGLLAFQYVGTDGLEIKPSGDLIVLTPFGGFITPAPRITQEIDGKEEKIEGEFIIADDTTVTYQIGPYDKQYPLTIE
ncbi:MAG: hypothetical protein U9N73_12105 [Candidatus Auribacterota bacterium]|nr:hypothetical protein [Candidatus Auribacterota bacterium]